MIAHFHAGPYPTSNPRMRQRGGLFLFSLLPNLLQGVFFVDFSQRGRYGHHRRGGGGRHRPPHRNPNYEQSADTNENPTTTSNSSHRNFHSFFRLSMLQDPWANMTAQKVPGNGTSLVSDSFTQ